MKRDPKDPDRDDLFSSDADSAESSQGDDSDSIWDLSERLGFEQGLDVEDLEPDHLRAVLGLPFDAQVRLLSRAVSGEWSVVRLRAEAAGVVHEPGKAIAAPPRDELVALYVDQQLAVSAVAHRYGVTGPTARKWLVAAGIELRSRLEQLKISKGRQRDDAAALDEAQQEPAPESPAPVDASTPSVRVRRRDDKTPARKRPEYHVDARDRVVRIDQDEPPRREPRKRREPERPRVEVLDLGDDTVQRRGAVSGGPPVRQVDMRKAPVASPASSRTPSRSISVEAPASEADAETDALVALHIEEGYSVPELALRLGRSVREVREALLATGRGWVRSWRGRHQPGEALPPREHLSEALEAGHSVAELAEAHDVSIARVRAWLDSYDLALDTGTRVERYRKVDGQQAAVVTLAEGAQVIVDTEIALDVAGHVWEVSPEGVPVTKLPGFELPLSWFVLGLEPGEAVEVAHRNADLLDCRRANLIRRDLDEAS